LRTLLIHGVLHLIGYDHERSIAEARRMFVRERELAAALDRLNGQSETQPRKRREFPAAPGIAETANALKRVRRPRRALTRIGSAANPCQRETS
jgi:hypothetical protein